MSRVRLASSALAFPLILLAGSPGLAEEYVLGPDSLVQQGVPRGEVTKHSWTSHLYPGTVRDYWVYVPKQYDPARPTAVMVFQDGAGYVKEDGQWRVPIVFDNLIHKREMPVTVGIFINPGVVPAPSDDVLSRFNRSFEYDSVSDLYVRFLLEEILPEVGKKVNLATDGNSRAIAGASSGAICAFTAAWERPDAFRRVFSTIGTYVGLRGGHAYPTLVRKTEPKPLRVFLQDGSNDLNIYGGNWWLANQEMLSAFEFAGYDVNHAWGDGAHDGKQGGAILPDALRWLWRDYPAAVASAGPSKQPLFTNVLLPGEGWEEATGVHATPEAPAVNAKGELFLIEGDGVRRLGPDGRATAFATGSEGVRGLAFGPDGRLYAAQPQKKRIVAFGEDGKEAPVAEGIEAHDLVVGHRGRVYATEPSAGKVWRIDGGQQTIVDSGIVEPSGIALSPDQSLLFVADRRGQFVYSFQLGADGSLGYKQPFFHLHLAEGDTESGASGLAVDANGYLYVSTRLGVQVCDQAGRVNGILVRPQPGELSGVAFGGPERSMLYVVAGDRLYRRKTQARGVRSFEAPVKPNPPRL
jgi:sugar lactone lactonase YvrE/enterochelin esterase-like enzyme